MKPTKLILNSENILVPETPQELENIRMSVKIKHSPLSKFVRPEPILSEPLFAEKKEAKFYAA